MSGVPNKTREGWRRKKQMSIRIRPSVWDRIALVRKRRGPNFVNISDVCERAIVAYLDQLDVDRLGDQ